MKYDLHRRMPYFGKLLTLCTGLLVAAPSLHAAPRITSPEPFHDFGTHPGTTVLSHVFVIENRGDADLALGRIHACCGATARVATNRLAAGEQTSLHVTLSLAGRQGAQDKHLFIASNDPTAPLFRLTMRAVAGAEIQGAPLPAVASSTVSSEEPGESTVEPEANDARGQQAENGKVIVDYFYEPGCPACRRIETRIFPGVLEHFGENVDLRKWNVSKMDHVLRLMAYQDALGLHENHPVLMVVDYQTALHGVSAIENRLREALEVALASRTDPAFADSAPILVPDAMDGVARGQSRLEAFSMPAILLAGLIDGLNPCAMTALTFLMSLLAASKVRGDRLLFLGFSYCLAAFLTYLTIGLGLLQAFDLFHAIPLVRLAVEMVLVVGLLVVAALSFRDAWRFSRSQRADAVQVKLPKPVMRLSHAIMRRGVRTRHLVLGGFLSGVAVTGVDSICTGQLYIPTLALIIRMAGGAESLRAWQLLLAYNAMFIVPLLTVFLLVWTGLRNETLQNWSKRHVVPGKILMGLLMLALAAGLLLLRSTS